MVFLYSSQIPRLCMSDHLLNPSISQTQKTMWELWFCSVPAAVQTVPARVPHQTNGNCSGGVLCSRGFRRLLCSAEFRESHHDELSHHTRCAHSSGCATRVWLCSVCHGYIC